MSFKRYWLFAGDNYYPGGGMDDFICSYDSEEEAHIIGLNQYDWYHVLDLEKGIFTYNWKHPKLGIRTKTTSINR